MVKLIEPGLGFRISAGTHEIAFAAATGQAKFGVEQWRGRR